MGNVNNSIHDRRCYKCKKQNLSTLDDYFYIYNEKQLHQYVMKNDGNFVTHCKTFDLTNNLVGKSGKYIEYNYQVLCDGCVRNLFKFIVKEITMTYSAEQFIKYNTKNNIIHNIDKTTFPTTYTCELCKIKYSTINPDASYYRHNHKLKLLEQCSSVVKDGVMKVVVDKTFGINQQHRKVIKSDTDAIYCGECALDLMVIETKKKIYHCQDCCAESNTENIGSFAYGKFGRYICHGCFYNYCCHYTCYNFSKYTCNTCGSKFCDSHWTQHQNEAYGWALQGVATCGTSSEVDYFSRSSNLEG